MDTIGKGPAILSDLRKRLALFCKQSWLFATRSYEIRYGRPFSAIRACKNSMQTVLYTLTTATIFNAAAQKLKQNAGGISLQKIVPKRERLTPPRFS